MKIRWSLLAKCEFEELLVWRATNSCTDSKETYRKNLKKKLKRLKKLPYSGQIELHKSNEIEARYIIYSNYKLLYTINLEARQITILGFFDTHRSSNHLSKILKRRNV